MTLRTLFRSFVLILAGLAAACGSESGSDAQGRAEGPAATAKPVPADARETRLRNVRQLTFGGENAEAYFDRTGTKLVFQSTHGDMKADQIFVMNIDGSEMRRVSNGKGRTTCAYWFPDGSRIIYASTHGAEDEPAPPPDRSHGYVWKLYDTYDLWTVKPDGSDPQRLTTRVGYDAEATIAPDGSKIVYTSLRDDDVDLYLMNLDGTGERRVTTLPGYDGGAFFSEDSKRLIWRASRPSDDRQREDWRLLIEQGLVRPTALEIYTADVDGRNVVQVTRNGRSNWAPFLHPDGERIIFCSNLGDPEGHRGQPNFDLWLINVDGTGLERVTYNESFDGFAMFSPDGKKLVFCSNRHGSTPGETNVFIADWVD